MIRVLNGPDISGRLGRLAVVPVRELEKDAPRYAQEVAAEAKRRAQTRPRRQKMGHIAANIVVDKDHNVRVTTPDAVIQEFGGKAPLFGSRRFRFLVRARNRDGWFLHPALKERGPTVTKKMIGEVDEAIRTIWVR